MKRLLQAIITALLVAIMTTPALAQNPTIWIGLGQGGEVQVTVDTTTNPIFAWENYLVTQEIVQDGHYPVEISMAGAEGWDVAYLTRYPIGNTFSANFGNKDGSEPNKFTGGLVLWNEVGSPSYINLGPPDNPLWDGWYENNPNIIIDDETGKSVISFMRDEIGNPVERLGPVLTHPATENYDASLRLSWTDPEPETPFQYLGFAYDIYLKKWVELGEFGMWYAYPADTYEGNMFLGYSGGYHVWISSQFDDGDWKMCTNPWTGIMYHGIPHTPVDVNVEVSVDNQVANLTWRPDQFGTSQYQIIVYRAGEGFVETTGDDGKSLWHFLSYPNSLNGAMDLNLPGSGTYVFFIRGVSWAPFIEGDHTTATATVE